MTLCAQGSPHGDEMSSPAGLQGSVRVLLPSLAGPLPAGILLGSPKLKTGKPSGSPQGQRPLSVLASFSGWLLVPDRSLGLLRTR